MNATGPLEPSDPNPALVSAFGFRVESGALAHP